jgi:hypothetical protein
MSTNATDPTDEPYDLDRFVQAHLSAICDQKR